MIVSAAGSSTTGAAVAAPRGDEAKQQRLADRMRVAEQTLATLKRSATRPNDEQKTRAREKLEAIRKRLEQLRMMGGAPRQIAALAKELKEAVRAYGRAGGSTADAGVSSADATQPAEAVAESAARDGATQDAATAEPAPTEVPVAVPVTDTDKPSSSPEGGNPENPYDKAIAAHAESVAAAARRSSESQEDRDFALKARQLANQLKGAAIQAAQKAKQSGKPAEAADAAEAIKAAEDADKALGDIRQTMGGAASLTLGSVSV